MQRRQSQGTGTQDLLFEESVAGTTFHVLNDTACNHDRTMPDSTPLQSEVVTSPADAMLGAAVALVLASPASKRAELFLRQVREIEAYMAAHPQERPWTCTVWTGTDGSRIFRGGVGHSLVIDPAGRVWRARSYEDFHTEYALTQNSCEIVSLSPQYEQMREYLPQRSG